MSDLSEDDSLADALSDYNEAFFADAREELDPEEEEEMRINEQLTSEMELYFSETFNHSDENNGKLRKKLRFLEDFEYSIENIDDLKKLAIENYGLINNKIRKKAWKLLILHGNTHKYDNYVNTEISLKQIESHRYHNQVKLDVVRTLKRFPPQISNDLRSKLQTQLINVICKVLIQTENLHYYQGYHDICLTFLLVTGTKNCIPLIADVTLSHFKWFMESNMEKTVMLLSNIMPLIDCINGDVAEHLEKAELGVIFGLSWLITWYSHVSDDLKVILRLFDFFIASDPLMPIYLGAVIVCERSKEILRTECDMAALHTFVTKFPAQIEDLDYLESIIKKAIQLEAKHPVSTLNTLMEQWMRKREEIHLRLEEISDNEPNPLRYRGGKSKNEIAQQNNKTRTIVRRKLHDKTYVNRFLMGMVTAGVAAAAFYVFTTNPKDPAEDLLMKFYHLLSYKNF